MIDWNIQQFEIGFESVQNYDHYDVYTFIIMQPTKYTLVQ